MSEHFKYFSNWREQPAECAGCGWTAASLTDADDELFDALIEYTCPECGAILAVVSYPTLDEIEKAAKEGDPEATGMLEKHLKVR